MPHAFSIYDLSVVSTLPLVFDEAQTYTGDPTPLTASRTYQWIHSLPRILCALTAAGLVLDFVHEHRWLP